MQAANTFVRTAQQINTNRNARSSASGDPEQDNLDMQVSRGTQVPSCGADSGIMVPGRLCSSCSLRLQRVRQRIMEYEINVPCSKTLVAGGVSFLALSKRARKPAISKEERFAGG